MYFKLKSALLEETLMDISFDDLELKEPTDSPENSPAVENINGTCSKENKTSLPVKFEMEKENSCWSVEENKEDKKVSEIWGSHLNNKLKPESKPSVKRKSENASAKISQKLFKNSSFSKRNPRKSLSNQSLNRSESNLSISLSQPDSQLSQNSVAESLPEFEQILLTQNESESLKTNETLNSTTLPKTLRSIDRGWLDRCTLQTNISEPDSGFSSLEYSSHEFSKPDSQKSYGLSNIDVTHLQYITNKPNLNPVENDVLKIDDIVYNSESDDDSNNIKQILKKRKIGPTQISPTFKISVSYLVVVRQKYKIKWL